MFSPYLLKLIIDMFAPLNNGFKYILPIFCFPILVKHVAFFPLINLHWKNITLLQKNPIKHWISVHTNNIFLRSNYYLHSIENKNYVFYSFMSVSEHGHVSTIFFYLLFFLSWFPGVLLVCDRISPNDPKDSLFHVYTSPGRHLNH